MDYFTSAWNAYIERKLLSLVQELKQNQCLSQDFEFLTEAEFAQVFLDAFNNLDDS